MAYSIGPEDGEEIALETLRGYTRREIAAQKGLPLFQVSKMLRSNRSRIASAIFSEMPC